VGEESARFNTQHIQEKDIRTPVGFEPAVPSNERPQTHALDRAATGIGLPEIMSEKYFPVFGEKR
jgi:hypothetical protein